MWGAGRLAARAPASVRHIALALAATIWLAVLLAGLRSGREAATQRAAVGSGSLTNVLVLVVDTLRADALGCYGYALPTSGAIDALARDGVRFSRCFAASSWTRPSTASILTGLHPSTHQQYQQVSVIPADSRMIPDAMSDYGYRTAFISTDTIVNKTGGFAKRVDLYSGFTELPAHTTSLFYCLHRTGSLLGRPLGAPVPLPALFEWIGWALAPVDGEARNDAAWANEQFLTWLDRDADALSSPTSTTWSRTHRSRPTRSSTRISATRATRDRNSTRIRSPTAVRRR
jgi:hypothetical protein